LIALFAVLILLLAITAIIIASDTFGGDSSADTTTDEVAAVATATSVADESVDSSDESAVIAATATELPIPDVVDFPTNTPAPTAVPTDTPVPTNTPEPTAIPTNPPPTNPPPPPPPPTSTPLPPTVPPPPPGPSSVNGLIGSGFGLQPRSVFAVNQLIWFEFSVSNNSGGNVPFGSLGAMVRRDGADVQYKNSWGGNMDSVPPGGLSADDNLSIGTSGNYTIRLVICFDDHNTCVNGGGTFHTLSQEIPFSIP
jgi:hypothetical protein